MIPVEAGVGEIQVRSGLHYVTPSKYIDILCMHVEDDAHTCDKTE